jgi:hypothetical protein
MTSGFEIVGQDQRLPGFAGDRAGRIVIGRGFRAAVKDRNL